MVIENVEVVATLATPKVTIKKIICPHCEKDIYAHLVEATLFEKAPQMKVGLPTIGFKYQEGEQDENEQVILGYIGGLLASPAAGFVYEGGRLALMFRVDEAYEARQIADILDAHGFSGGHIIKQHTTTADLHQFISEREKIKRFVEMMLPIIKNTTKAQQLKGILATINDEAKQ